ncbi:uroplakin-3b-like [Protopterus annectens]|uniref:uroplakin-3b-like n=1 Tax=Protopterus annectens TaxID=7888 RepID=UPI001CFAC945|nr:uroplakin-3b-like [Protopterus annectens]
MDQIQRLLLVTLFFSSVKSQVPVIYIPEIVQNDILGKITASTFTLKQPVCAFKEITNCGDCTLWVAVATEKGAVDAINTATAIYPNFPNTSPVFLTLSTPINQFSCSDITPGTFRGLRVGADTACQNSASVLDCNGPLPSNPGTYRVRYYLQATNNTFVAMTSWSQPITLRKAKSWEDIDTWPGKRTGGMVVVTTILIVLLALLLVLLTGMLVYSCTPHFQKGENYAVPPAPTGSFRITKYNTHSMSETNTPGAGQGHQATVP